MTSAPLFPRRKNGSGLKTIWWVLLVGAAAVMSGCGDQSASSEPPGPIAPPAQTARVTATTVPTASATPSPIPSPTASSTPTASPTPTLTPAVLIGAGDIAVCGVDGDEQTAAILDAYPQSVIFTAGDNAYSSGSAAEYRSCFNPSWGRHKDRIRPVPGNHDYVDPGAAAYFAYFGEAAGEPGKGYYSYELGEWHIVALNSNCAEAGGCGLGSPQEQWLRADLAASGKRCALAYMHFPRWSSGLAGGRGTISALYRALVDSGVEVLVSGDDHHYERFAPMDGDGLPDIRGVRQFVVGTGGGILRGLSTPQPNSEMRLAGTYGVLKFSLSPDSYTWEFVPAGGEAVKDSGQGVCH